MSCEGGGLGDLFRSMAYNTQQIQDLSPISNWLGPHQNVISWIVGGKWTEAEPAGGRSQSEFEFTLGKDTKVGLGVGGAKLLQGVLDTLENANGKEAQDTDGGSSRLEKLRNLVTKLRPELVVAESIATQVPSWQINEYDQPTWTNAVQSTKDSFNSNSSSKSTVVLLHLSRTSYSLQRILSDIMSPAVEEGAGRFVLAVFLNSARDSSTILPIAYLVDAINKAEIRKTPIDLLILDPSSSETWKVLKQKSDTTKIYVWGEIQTFEHLPLHLVSGVFSAGDGKTGDHFIVDSSADIQTAAESIAANVWSCGTKMNFRSRSLLFVHQPVYEDVVKAVERKISGLRIGTDVNSKLTDFISRPNVFLSSKQMDGAKVSFGGSDLSGPTLVSDIGTSSDLVTTPTTGTGHVLVVIPYRSSSELLNLTNNFDAGKTVFVFATDVDFFRRTAGLIKARDIWLNTSRISSSQSTNILAQIGKANLNAVKTPHGPTNSLISKQVENAVKASKSWASLSTSKRLALLEKVIDKVSASLSGGQSGVLGAFLKIAGRFSEGAAGNLTLQNLRPAGVVGIILGNGKDLPVESQLMALLMSAVKGNVTVVMSLSQSPSLPVLEETCGSVLPGGVVSFVDCSSSTLSSLLGATAPLGKLNLLWLIQDSNAEENLSLESISLNAYNRVIVDSVNSANSKSPPLFEQRSEFLENVTTINL